jgi:hypothetical protein
VIEVERIYLIAAITLHRDSVPRSPTPITDTF